MYNFATSRPKANKLKMFDVRQGERNFDRDAERHHFSPLSDILRICCPDDLPEFHTQERVCVRLRKMRDRLFQDRTTASKESLSPDFRSLSTIAANIDFATRS